MIRHIFKIKITITRLLWQLKKVVQGELILDKTAFEQFGNFKNLAIKTYWNNHAKTLVYISGMLCSSLDHLCHQGPRTRSFNNKVTFLLHLTAEDSVYTMVWETRPTKKKIQCFNVGYSTVFSHLVSFKANFSASF